MSDLSGFFIVPEPEDPNAPTAEEIAAAKPIAGVTGFELTRTLPLPEVLTADDPRVRACTAGGVAHDYRAHVETRPLEGTDPHTYLRCVWCHGVTCGHADETDPCIEPYHHRVPHRTRMGVTWPIGGNRP